MPSSIILSAQHSEQWYAVLERVGTYDFYHTPEYHALAEEQGQGVARLFVYHEGDHCIALPFLLRQVGPGGDLGNTDSLDLRDVISVYGYCGPLTNSPAPPEGFQCRFVDALTEALQGLRVVSVFARLHPLLQQEHLLRGMGHVVAVGPTVSIDLTPPADLQARAYRRSHKRDISRLRRLGVVCVRDAALEHLHDLVSIYSEAMARLGASEEYLFPEEYFRDLAEALGDRLQLFYCTHEGRIACADLFTLCCGIVQGHLGGTREWAMPLAPTKLLFDTVRLWAIEQGAHTLHLGGGVGAREDSLFHFKAGFSPRRHTFKVWKWIVIPEEYSALCRAREERARLQGIELAPTSYFPEYRAPIVSAQRES